MSETETYDARVQAIRAYNRPLLEDFGSWLDHKGFSEQTVITHLGNIYLFASYLVYYEPLKKLDITTLLPVLHRNKERLEQQTEQALPVPLNL